MLANIDSVTNMWLKMEKPCSASLLFASRYQSVLDPVHGDILRAIASFSQTWMTLPPRLYDNLTSIRLLHMAAVLSERRVVV